MAEKIRESDMQKSSVLSKLRFTMTCSLLGEDRRVLELGAELLGLGPFGIGGQMLLCCGVSCALQDHLGTCQA